MRKQIAGLFVFLGVLVWAEAVAESDAYTYVKASLGYPWFMFFVFLALVAIPFLLIIFLSWRVRENSGDPQNQAGDS